MFKNYLTVAARSLLRNRLYSSISVISLAVGMAFCILTFLYLRNEWTFDTFHKHADQLYRIHEIERSPAGGEEYWARSPNPLATALKNDYPGLLVTSLDDRESWIRSTGQALKETVYFADEEFFELFQFSFSKGNPGTALKEVYSAVLTEELAEKYFGSEDPLGKVMELDNRYPLTVTGVLKSLPENSSIKFGILAPASLHHLLNPESAEHWWEGGTFTYVRCSPDLSPQELAVQLPLIEQKYFPEYMRNRISLHLQPLLQAHLDTRTTGEMVPGVSPTYLNILALISFSVLMISCFNFTNLSTACFAARTKEIGVRKTLGAQRSQLVGQFLGETVLLSLLTLFLGVALVELALPAFDRLIGRALELHCWDAPLALAGLLGFGGFVGVCAGAYPAFFLSAYQPAKAVRGLKAAPAKKSGLRRGLIVAQFAISSLLIVCEIVVIRQVRYMKTKDLGFHVDQVVAIPTGTARLPDEHAPRIDTYLQAIESAGEGAGIAACAISEEIPGLSFHNTFGVIPEGKTREEALEMVVTSIDGRFLDTYGMHLMEGRTFSPAFGTDPSYAVLLNETAARQIGWPSPMGRSLTYVHDAEPLQIIGVVADIHFKSLQHRIEPVVYRFAGDKYRRAYISVRIHPGQTQNALHFLETKWKELLPDRPFEYSFVADGFAESYRAEEQTTEIIGDFSLVAIGLACFGLFGLSALSATQRTKEIGIRKVLGASGPSIVMLLSKEFTYLVLIANMVAWPLAWYVMHRWLENFAYRIELEPGIFVLGGVLVLVIAWLTVSYQAISAARANPVEALRYE
ncbi:MAG: ABC transporter permease [Candidatus Latescibacteria bacterium]|nr:ABC transporter permease [Candidatus Latescibacterota bacterium]